MSTTSLTSSVPFRTELRTPSSHTVSIEAAPRFQTTILQSIHEATQHPDEIAVWCFSRRLMNELLPFTLDMEHVLKHAQKLAPLIDRALRDADSEGLIWTPLLDVWAESPDWKYLAIKEIKREDGSPFPHPQDRAAKLGEWIRTRNDPRELEALLVFRSDVIRCVLAAEAQVFDESLIDYIAASARSSTVALENEAAPEFLRTRVLSAAYERWRRAILSAEEQQNDPAKPILYHALAEDDAFLFEGSAVGGLPEALRERMVEDLARPFPYRDPIYVALAVDPNTPRYLLATIAQSAPPYLRVKALLHPNSDLDLIRQTLDQAENDDALVAIITSLLDGRVNEGFLTMVLDDYLPTILPYIPVLKQIVVHPSATPRIWRKIAQHHRHSNVLLALAEHAPARRDPVVYASLKTSRSQVILKALLKDATPREYSRFLSRLAQVSIDDAVLALRMTPPPEGTTFSDKLVARLLRASRAEDRLTVITQIVGRPDAVPMSQSEATARHRHKR